ncbi:MAG: hypothetical protein AB7J28_11450 [Hyphomonadaceae bacterium]
MGRLFIGVGVCAAALTGHAHAGAWIAPEGGQEIASVAYGRDGDAHVVEADYYFERPVGRSASIVARPWVEGRTEFETQWRGEATIAGKAALLRGERATIAVQAGAVWRSDPAPGCGEAGGEVRALAGLSRGRVFFNAEAAQQTFSGGCERQRYELTAGFRPAARWLTMAQAFVEAGAGDESIQAQLSAVRFGRDGGALQVGLRARLDGDGPAAAFVLGWWGASRR